MNKRQTGSRYESMAADYLTSQGYEILCRNYQNHRRGEIDLIARDGNTLAFIEVKYRKNLTAGEPAEAVDVRKQQRIRKAALSYLYENRFSMDTACRFDVVTVLGQTIRLIRDAF